MFHFWSPLLGDVLQTVRGVYAEAHEDDISVGVGERTQPVVVFLTRSVPECQLNLEERTGLCKCHNTRVCWAKKYLLTINVMTEI